MLALVADFFKNGENFLISSWFCGCFSFFLCGEFIDNANEDKDTEGNNEEIYDVLNEVSIAKVSSAGAAEEVRNGNFEISKIDTTKDDADDWHNEVVDERADNFIERSTDNDTNS